MNDVVKLFGIPVAKVTEQQALTRIVEMVREGRAALQAGEKLRARMVATLNVDFVANAVKGWPFGGNEELWRYLKSADFVTADGMPIVLLSKLLFRPLPERVAGSDLVPALCRCCAEEGLRIYVLGASESALTEAFTKMQTSWGNDVPPLLIAGTDSSVVSLDGEQPEIIARANAAKPDLLFVALGNPKQELWMGRNLEQLQIPIVMGIGGTFNFLSGRVKRAPRWMQRCGLEWIYRIIQEPGRLWRRYAYGLVKFSWLSLRALCGGYRE
ncbi:MAG: WecB/TagA/CpsF family glycosyltransferase [Kiritimatiellae bacterium]|nr:WecB/TagA/CpsF family glycosyltransferase [Kiritimatiellia bacterium]